MIARPRSFEFAVTACLSAVLAGVLLQRLAQYQALAEEAHVEATVRTLQAALRLRIGTLMIQGRLHTLPDLARENPFDWLDQKPIDYCGPHRGAGLETGCWYYDWRQGEILYRFLHTSAPGRERPVGVWDESE